MLGCIESLDVLETQQQAANAVNTPRMSPTDLFNAANTPRMSHSTSEFCHFGTQSTAHELGAERSIEKQDPRAMKTRSQKLLPGRHLSLQIQGTSS